jgi:anaerobic dimethyl sulfoxide reductase subunit C (anchor subunit)
VIVDTQELPLVVFTILAQMSVGAFVVLGVVHVLAGRKAQATVDKLSDPALYAIVPVMIAALIASLFHLGDPFHALYTGKNFEHSWLSREIVFGVAFTALAFAFAASQLFKWFTPLVRQGLAGLTALVGLALVFVMSMVYMLPTVPGWDTWATPVGFFTTAFLLGSLAIGAAFVATTTIPRLAARHGGDTGPLLRQSLRGISVAAIVLLGVEFVMEPTYALQLASRGGIAAHSAHLLLFGGGSVFIVRLALVFAGAGLLGTYLHLQRPPTANLPATFTLASASGGSGLAASQRLMVYAASAAFTLVLASEVLGRILFYTGFARIGI